MEKKIIGVISGKGGVGKTSLVASLASLAYKDSNISVIALDCDVDAPNLALILPPKNNNDIQVQEVYTTLKSYFLPNKCIQCKKCIDDHFCEFNALKWNNEKNFPIIDNLACEGCGACKVLCSEHAFKIEPVKSGDIIAYTTIYGFPLVYGKTNLGSSTSGKTVSDVKEFAKKLKEFEKSNLIIIDGAPGIGCPVIATVSGLDYVITITEPTPSGLHDLLRAIEVVEQFKIPFGIIVNKSDLESTFQYEFKRFIKERSYTILGKIPFDFSIPLAMSFAEPVVDNAPNSKASKSIKKIYTELKKNLWKKPKSKK
jgi:MinD superfamily P-loop ATPase